VAGEQARLIVPGADPLRGCFREIASKLEERTISFDPFSEAVPLISNSVVRELDEGFAPVAVMHGKNARIDEAIDERSIFIGQLGKGKRSTHPLRRDQPKHQ
jgi:hypothetical protein